MLETLIPAGLQFLGGLMSSDDQADTAKQAANQANALQREQFDWMKSSQQPWIDAGSRGLKRYERAVVQGRPEFQFTETPGYQFRLGEGEKAINRAAAASGRFDSGRTLKDLLRYGQNYASNEYGAEWNRNNQTYNEGLNRLAALAGLGQGALSQVGAAGQNYANTVGANTGNAMLMGANARGSMWNGMGNTLGNVFSSMYQSPQGSQPASGGWSGNYSWSPVQYGQEWQYE